MAGSTWGIFLYYIFTEIFIQNLTIFIDHLQSKSFTKLFWNFGTKIFLFVYFLAYTTYLIGSRINKVPQDWLKNIEKNCGEEILYEAKDPEL